MRRPELAAAVAFALLAGCARQPLHFHMDSSPVGQYEFLMVTLNLDNAGRESVWQKIQRQPAGSETTLRHALMRGVPGHTGYDMAAAESELQNFINRDPQSDLAPVARARLEDLRAARACRAENDMLKRRLSKVVDIERRQDQNRKQP